MPNLGRSMTEQWDFECNRDGLFNFCSDSANDTKDSNFELMLSWAFSKVVVLDLSNVFWPYPDVVLFRLKLFLYIFNFWNSISVLESLSSSLNWVKSSISILWILVELFGSSQTLEISGSSLIVMSEPDFISEWDSWLCSCISSRDNDKD